MTKFTKEQLISRALIMIRKHREMLAINPDYDGIARDVELFELALAALTEQPVGFYRASRHGDGYYLANNMEQTPGTIPLYRLPLLEGLE